MNTNQVVLQVIEVDAETFGEADEKGISQISVYLSGDMALCFRRQA